MNFKSAYRRAGCAGQSPAGTVGPTRAGRHSRPYKRQFELNTVPSNSPLAIVGIGCLFPKAAGPGFFWANVKHGVDCVTAIPATHWDPADYFDADPKSPDMTYARRGGFLEAVEFSPMEFGIAPRDIEATDT